MRLASNPADVFPPPTPYPTSGRFHTRPLRMRENLRERGPVTLRCRFDTECCLEMAQLTQAAIWN